MVRTLLLATLLFCPTLVFAQVQDNTAGEAQESVANASQQLPEKEIKLQLATKMHEIRPTRVQVEMAIDELARRSVPEDQRVEFKQRMLGAMNIESLQQVSIEAMVEVFTLAELERMVAYYMTPEAQSISAKMPMYQGIVQPQIIKMLDNAMLEMRTGSAGNASSGQ